jgi:outer membrane protein
MNVSRSPRTAAAVYSLAGLLGLGATGPAAADPHSDVFAPDAFGTRSTLQNQMQGLRDPFGAECGPLPAVLSLSAAVDVALCRNPATRTAWAQAHAAAAALGSAESAWLPTISVQGGESRSFGPHVDVTGNETDTPQNTADAAAELSWTLYDFGNRGSRIHGARLLLDAAAGAADRTVQQTVFNVAQSFYSAAAADAQLLAAQTTETTAQRSLEAARALQTGGVATLGDVLQAQTAYQTATLSRIQAQNAVKDAYGTFCTTLGVTADQPLRLQLQPVPAQVPALTARLSDLMSEAQRQRPDLAAARAQRDAAEAAVSVARAAGRPSIAVSAGREWINTDGVPVQSYGQIGVTVTVPIFTGFSVGYGVRQAQAQLEGEEVNAEQIRLTVSLDVWNAYYALDSAGQQLTQTATLIQTAQNNQDVALGRYQSGVGTFLDLLTAQTAAASARQLRVQAELNWQVARAQLVLALGRLSSAEPLAGTAPVP